MNSQHNNQNDGEGQKPDAARAGAAQQALLCEQGDLACANAAIGGDSQELAQAVRAVMHPERHEPEWRYVHGATHG